jgi:hypothetical protein
MKNLRIRFESPDLLNKIKEAAEALLLPEIQFKIGPDDGLVLNMLDSSKAAHLRVLIPTTDFDGFELPEEKMFCINMESFGIAISRLKRLKEPIEMEFVDNEIILSNIGTPKRDFSIPLLTPNERVVEINNDLQTIVEVDAKEMYEQSLDLEKLAEYAIIELKDGHLFILGNGDKGKVSIQTSLEDNLVKSHSGPNAKAMYAMNFLLGVFKFFKQFETINIRLEDNKPITLTTNIGKGEIRILIAPRVERH